MPLTVREIPSEGSKGADGVFWCEFGGLGRFKLATLGLRSQLPAQAKSRQCTRLKHKVYRGNGPFTFANPSSVALGVICPAGDVAKSSGGSGPAKSSRWPTILAAPSFHAMITLASFWR